MLMRLSVPLRAAVVGLCAFGSTIALAGFTPTNPATAPELGVNGILNGVYNTTFTQVGFDYVSSSMTATRIMDTPNTVGKSDSLFNAVNVAFNLDGNASARPNVTGSGGTVNTTDQLWTADSVHAIAEARYALYDQHFGYFPGTSGGSYHNLFDLSGTGLNVSGQADLNQSMSGTIWRWARYGHNGGLVTSQNSDNPDGLDHMITFRIDPSAPTARATPATPAAPVGSSNATTYLLFFEDKLPNDHPDYDYNDLVVQIDATSGATPTPEPASLGALALMGLFGLRRRQANMWRARI